MNSIFGITGVRVKSVFVDESRPGAIDIVNSFLEEYDGNIINIEAFNLDRGFTRYIITYKAVD